MEKKTAFKDLSRKAKVQYIWDYYRWHIVAAICLVAFAISMIVHYASYRETIFYKGIMPSEKILDLPVDCNFLTGSVNL